MSFKNYVSPGRPRIPLREIPCSECGTPYGQTAAEMRKSLTRCPACKKAVRITQNKLKKAPKPSIRGTLEIVLPGRRNGFFDSQKGDWYIRVRVRKRHTDEELKKDRIYLLVGASATPEQVSAAVTATCARLELNGSSSMSKEQRAAAWKRRKSVHAAARKWDRGRNKDLGILKRTVSRVIYKVVLPDPLADGKTRRFGSYQTRDEARKVRNAHYKQLETELLPCAFCGIKPTFRNSMLTHFSGACENRVQIPSAMRKLFQTKLWNLVFSEGKCPNAGKLTPDELHAMGYMKKGDSGRCYGRADVEWDFSLAKNYLRKLEIPDEEEIGFE